MAKKLRIYYCYTNPSTFVSKDLEILTGDHILSSKVINTNGGIRSLWNIVKQFLYLVLRPRSFDLYISQFAGHHTFIPAYLSQVFNIPFLVIAGGTESVSFPKLNYGNLRPSLLGKTTSFSLKKATHIAPVDESLIFQEYQYSNPYASGNQGMKALINGIHTPHTVIHNGFRDFQSYTSEMKELKILSIVGGAEEERRAKLKGVDFLIEIAQKAPHIPIVIIGASEVPFDLPTNVELVPFLPHEKLYNYLKGSMFYAQLSVSEGFPNALCEAMLCECVPIVTGVGAMPEIVRENGLILYEKSVDQVLEFISEPTRDQVDRSKKARESILERYPLNRRKSELLNLVAELTN